jgi:hypothetical protein
MYWIVVMDVLVEILSFILLWIIMMEYVPLKQKKGSVTTLSASARVDYNAEILLKIVRVYAT